MHIITCSVVGRGNRDETYSQSFLLLNVIPVNKFHSCYQSTFAQYKLSQCFDIAFYQFRSWCLQLHITEYEDTHPTFFQNRFDSICLKNVVSVK